MPKPKIREKPVSYTKTFYDYFEVRDWLLAEKLITKKQHDAFWRWLCEVHEVSNESSFSIDRGELSDLELDCKEYPFPDCEIVKGVYETILNHFKDSEDTLEFEVSW